MIRKEPGALSKLKKPKFSPFSNGDKQQKPPKSLFLGDKTINLKQNNFHGGRPPKPRKIRAPAGSPPQITKTADSEEEAGVEAAAISNLEEIIKDKAETRALSAGSQATEKLTAQNKAASRDKVGTPASNAGNLATERRIVLNRGSRGQAGTSVLNAANRATGKPSALSKATSRGQAAIPASIAGSPGIRNSNALSLGNRTGNSEDEVEAVEEGRMEILEDKIRIKEDRTLLVGELQLRLKLVMKWNLRN